MSSIVPVFKWVSHGPCTWRAHNPVGAVLVPYPGDSHRLPQPEEELWYRERKVRAGQGLSREGRESAVRQVGGQWAEKQEKGQGAQSLGGLSELQEAEDAEA